MKENQSFDSDTTEMPTPTINESVGNDMSMHTKMWTLEKTLNERLRGLEDKVNLLLLKNGHANMEMPPTPPGDEVSFAELKGKQRTTANEASHKAVPLPQWSFASLAADNEYEPAAVRSFPTLKDMPLAQQPFSKDKELTSFPKDFILNLLGGSEYSPGLYYPAINAPTSQIGALVNHKSYYLIDAFEDPFVPKKAGDHGAKLTVVMRALKTEKMVYDAPLFVHTGEKDEASQNMYQYLGHYSQTRWSDRLDYDRIQEVVPESVKKYWAYMLANKDKPQWMKEELMKALIPKPEFEGDISDSSDGTASSFEPHSEGDAEDGDSKKATKSKASLTRAKMDMQTYLEDLQAWKEEAETTMKSLTEEGVMEAFDRVSNARILVKV